MGLWRSLATLLMFFGLAAPSAWSQQTELPVLFDARERLVRPDVSGALRLRFLTTTDFPPFNFTDQSGRLSGFHIDLARALCEELGLQAHVKFTGRVPHAQVQRYYSLVDVLVYPRKSMRLTELVTPLKPLEAMAQPLRNTTLPTGTPGMLCIEG